METTEKNKTRKYTIKVSNFLSWYFDTGADQDQKQQLYDLGSNIVKRLKEHGSYQLSVQNIFENTDFESLPVKFLEENDFDDDFIELGELGHDYHIQLIN